MEQWRDALTIDEKVLKSQQILVVENEKEVFGFCAIEEHVDNYELTHLWLSPSYIGKGLGKKLLAKTIERFIIVNKPILVEADPNAEDFYKSQGFTTYDRVESTPAGRYLPVMKRLPTYQTQTATTP